MFLTTEQGTIKCIHKEFQKANKNGVKYIVYLDKILIDYAFIQFKYIMVQYFIALSRLNQFRLEPAGRKTGTPQPLYNTVAGSQNSNCVS